MYWGLTSQSTIFQSCRDGANTSGFNQYCRELMCLSQGHNTVPLVGIEPRTSRFRVRCSTTSPPRSLREILGSILGSNPNDTGLCPEARHIWAALWEHWIFAYAKTKPQISFAVTAKLISAFVFATRIVHFLFFLYPKFQASSPLLWLYRSVCVRPGRKPWRPVFSRRGSFTTRKQWLCPNMTEKNGWLRR